jgi:hypothetical protein
MEGMARIEKHFFTGREQTLVSYDGLTAILFIYPSGVRAVRIETDRGHIVVLPYMGQQIWDAVMDGRRLTMGSMFQYPKCTDFFLHSYGCFMMHCGAFRMGGPGPEDSHSLHGELPCAPYTDVEIRYGSDDQGTYMGITGRYDYDMAFTTHYSAKPSVTLRKGSTLMDIAMHVENRSRYDMELMYMCHINYRPVDHGRIVQSLPWDTQHMVLRKSIPEHISVSDNFLAFMDRLEHDPSLTRTLKPEDEYKPELAIFMRDPATDERGLSHFMQVHPDGQADYVGFNPELLDRPTRWIMRTGEQEALGIALPSTCDPEGYSAEKRKGHIKHIAGGSSVDLSARTGILDRKEAVQMEKHIEGLIKNR